MFIKNIILSKIIKSALIATADSSLSLYQFNGWNDLKLHKHVVIKQN